MAVAESWLNDNINLNLKPYNLVRNDRGLINLDSRKDTKGGGVAFFIHNTLNYVVVATSKVKRIGQVQFLMVRVLDPATKNTCLLACVYRPPRGEFMDGFFEILMKNRRETEGAIIVGDLNCHLERKSSTAIELKSLAEAVQMEILETGCSFHEWEHQSWLDVVILDDSSKVNRVVKSIVPFIDFHDSFIVEYEFETQPVSHPCFPVRSFKHFDILSFKKDISLVTTINCSRLDNMQPYQLLHKFNNDVLTVLDRHAPIHLISPRPKFKPWLTDEIRYLITKRNQHYKIFKKTKRIY